MKTNRQLAEDIMAGRDPKWGRFYTEGNTQEKQAAYQEVMRLLNDANKPVVEDDELSRLRQSVRRLAEKWTEAASQYEESFRRTGSSTSGLLSDLYESNSKELSALIDGKDGEQTTKPSSVFGAMASSDYTKKHGLP